MNPYRVLLIKLTRGEIGVLTEVMSMRGCSIEEAVRHLIAKHGKAPRASSNLYMRDYMRDYRSAMRLGIPVSEYRKRKEQP
jgi:hypothetical protein